MRILYLHQYFTTRAGVGATRSYEFAKRFVARGHEVTMVTAARATGRRGVARRTVDGIRVLEVPAGYADYVRGTAVSYPRRMAHFAAFATAATATVLRLPRPDVVYATSPPLTMALPALAASRRHRVPLVFEARDLWPEGPIQFGALQNPLIQGLARAFERLVYRSASELIALSPGIRDAIVQAGAAQSRVTVVPNGSDVDLFSPDVDGSGVRARLGLDGRFLCSWFGTMGQLNDLTPVIEAAALMKERGDESVAFVLLGDGKLRPELEELARRRGADNVLFQDPVPDKRSVAELAAASDACLTIVSDVPVLETCSPNKLFDTFAAGRPAVVNVPGWLRGVVERNEAGVFVRPGDASDLADKVAHLRDHPELVRRYGENARRLAEREFNRDMLAERALGVLERAVRLAGGSSQRQPAHGR